MQPGDPCQPLCKGWATHHRQLLELFLPHVGKNPENTTQKPVGGLETALAGSTAGNLGYPMRFNKKPFHAAVSSAWKGNALAPA